MSGWDKSHEPQERTLWLKFSLALSRSEIQTKDYIHSLESNLYMWKMKLRKLWVSQFDLG